MSMGLFGWRMPPAIAQQMKTDAEMLESLFNEEIDDATVCDVDWAWNTVHYALTGDKEMQKSDNPYSRILAGGQPHGEDVGYGPAQWLDPEEVVVVAKTVASVTQELLESNFDPDETDDLYGSPDEFAIEDFVMDYVKELQEFYTAAAAEGQAVVWALV